ncbi:MAG: hypothetical protein SFT90_06760 [Rickettsiales bacterium]|nr:hypothetical protein [Rickettsiales bacterium]
MKHFLTLLLLLTLASCGFEPLYENKNRGENSKSKCSNFKVKDPAISLPGKRMQYAIQDKLNQACINIDQSYFVDLNAVISEQAVAIQIDRQVTRFNVVLDGNYSLKNNETGKVLFDGRTRSVGGYDAVASEYGRYALKQDAKNKLAEEMAQDIAFKILYFLKSDKKNKAG